MYNYRDMLRSSILGASLIELQATQLISEGNNDNYLICVLASFLFIVLTGPAPSMYYTFDLFCKFFYS